MSRFHDDMTIGEARNILRELANDGHDCPICTQFAKVYRRKVHASMASGLIKLLRAQRLNADRGVYLAIADLMTHRELADFAKLAHWGLVEEEPGTRDDGSKRVGLWRVTQRGHDFAMNTLLIAKYARIYNGRCLGTVGEPVTIRDCLGDRFDYQELMYG